MQRRSIGPGNLILTWFRAHMADANRRSAITAWFAAAAIDYEIVVSARFVRTTEGGALREIFVADIDKARTTIVFTAWTTPYALVISEISDDLYVLRQHEFEFDEDQLGDQS